VGNIFNVDAERSMRYDRIYVGAACPTAVKEKLCCMLVPGREGQPGGMLVGPMVSLHVSQAPPTPPPLSAGERRDQRWCGGVQGEELVRVTRESEDHYSTAYLAAVRFAPLKCVGRRVLSVTHEAYHTGAEQVPPAGALPPAAPRLVARAAPHLPHHLPVRTQRTHAGGAQAFGLSNV
jgi:hypothetical protein